MTKVDKNKLALSKINEILTLLLDKKKDLDFTSEEYRNIVKQEIEYQKQILEICESMQTEEQNDFYKNEGLAIFYKGKVVLGIHPDNLENNLKALREGRMWIDWNNVVIASK